jgi:hypothetical protein
LKANALRFDIYLPIYYNEKDSSDNRLLVEEEKFLITYEELQNKFRGISVEDNPIRGSWLNDDGIHFDDESTVYHVLYKLTIDNLQWLGNYQEKLADRFRQEEIFLYYIEVYRF